MWNNERNSTEKKLTKSFLFRGEIHQKKDLPLEASAAELVNVLGTEGSGVQILARLISFHF
jgi:hypothetical protein